MRVTIHALLLIATVEAGVAWVGVAPAYARLSQEPAAVDGLLARAVARESAKLAEQGASANAVKAANANWSRVVRLKRGIPIVLTSKGSVPQERYLLAGDADGITVLDITGPKLPPEAVKALRDGVSHDPDCLMGARRGSPCALKNGVVVAPDGLFVADLKVAELPQVVSIVARGDVAEVRRAVDSSWWQHSLIGGFLAGAAYGAGVGALFCVAYHGCEPSDVLYVAAVGGAVWAPVTIAIGGAQHAYEKSKELVYLAPPA